MDALAHTRWDGEKHCLGSHLDHTATLASVFAASFGCADIARLAGLWHDLGKYRPGFQRYIAQVADAHIEGRVGGRDKTHSAAGALLAMEHYGIPGRALAYLIAGHHAGLADWHGGLDERLGADNVDGRRELTEARAAAPAELLAADAGAALAQALTKIPGGRAGAALWLRMLFSCLVDADFLDTEAFMDEARGDARNGFPGIAELLARFDAHIVALAAAAPPTDVNRLRADVLAQCRARAAERPGLFSLTVPTGGGKTLSSLAFALEHAKAHGKRRVIYAIPYTSIVEQTADVFGRIFGPENILEHHSQVEFDERQETLRSRLACENWDAPLVVTTNVQLFESLFAARTSRCRKLHNLCDSVVILDEAQCLPPAFLQPILDTMNLLTRYGISIVLCTATQPALASRTYFNAARSRRGLDDVREIVADPAALQQRLKRVDMALPDWNARVTWDGLAADLARRDCVLAIVCSRADARTLWRLMPEGTLHLSALMCGAHRADTIATIKQRLDDKRAGRDDRPLRVVSTQLVEAGVDLDFPVVYRAFGGLDSLAQAAGRCNREGRLERGEVVVFMPPQGSRVPQLRIGEDACRDVLLGHAGDPLALELFEKYFDRYYYNLDLDEKHVVADLLPDDRLAIQFRTAADKFRLIEDEGQASVFVRYAGVPDIDGLLGKLAKDGPERWLLRKLQRAAVTVREKPLARLLARGDVAEVRPGCFVQAGDMLYDPMLGLLDEEEIVLPPDRLIQ